MKGRPSVTTSRLVHVTGGGMLLVGGHCGRHFLDAGSKYELKMAMSGLAIVLLYTLYKYFVGLL